MNPVALGLVALAAVMILAFPRRLALVPLFLVAPLLGPGQAIMIGVFSFHPIRIILLVLLIRVLLRSEYRRLKHSPMDTLILLYFVCGTVAYVALRGTPSALVNRLGWAFDGLLVYFFVRWLVRDTATWARVLTALAAICLVISVTMMWEHRSGINIFSLIGSVAEMSEVRDGAVRSQGPFLHSILAGAFGANLAVLFVSLRWLRSRRSAITVAAVVCSVVIVASSSSSTPFMALGASMLALVGWSFRGYMRLVRWGIVACLVLLQLIMKDPVWAILAKFKIFGGSTGWYRYYLVDNFIWHFSDWCFLGTESTAKWGRGLWDVTIMYVRVGVDGGLITFVLFLAIIVQCYKLIGRTVRALPKTSRRRKCVWALGASLTGHLFTFFGVNYWDQNTLPWYTLLAVIAGAGEIFAEPRLPGTSGPTPAPEHAAAPQEAPERVRTDNLSGVGCLL